MKRGLFSFIVTLWVGFSSTTYALSLDLDGLTHRPFALDDSPLFLGAQTSPNVLLLADDSVSMSSNFVLDHDANSDGVIDKLGTGGSRDGAADQAQGMARATDNGRLIYPWLFPMPPTLSAICSNTANVAGLALPDEEGQPLCGQVAPSAELLQALQDHSWVRNDAGINSQPDVAGDLVDVWKLRSATYNPIYFDPNRTYSPWPGVDASGNAYGNASTTAARLNPYQPSDGTVDLTVLYEVQSVIRLQNGSYDIVTHERFSQCNGVILFGACVGFIEVEDTRYDISVYYDADGTKQDVSGAQLQNFANWFQYYRSRELVAKGIAASLVEMADGVRIAYATIHQNDAIAQPAVEVFANDPVDSGNKRSLLDAIYSSRAAAVATPLRRALEDAANYFRCEGEARYSDYYSPAASTENVNVVGDNSCPVLSEAEGGDCQLHNTVLLTDGYSTAHQTAVTHTGYPAETGSAGDAVQSFNTLDPASNHDGDDNSDVDGSVYGDTVAATLADAAMDAYERDLSSALEGTQRMHTHAIVVAAENAGSGDVDAILSGSESWPTPIYAGTGEPLTSDVFEYAALLTELEHATTNGRGSFLSGLNQGAAGQLIAALNSIGGSRLSGTNTSASSVNLDDDTLIFTTSYNFDNWTGDLIAYELDSDGSLNQLWSAASQLTSDSGRVIMTYDPRRPTSVATGYDSGGMAFTADNLEDLAFFGPIPLVGGLGSDLEDSFGSLLGLDFLGDVLGPIGNILGGLLGGVLQLIVQPVLDLLGALGLEGLWELIGLTGGLDADTINYVRGERSNEQQNGGGYRDRTGTVLGPILSSNPVYVGPPDFDYPDEFENPSEVAARTYQKFATDNANRVPMVYVGGNDGMLHGFEAKTGIERIAFVPSRTLTKLKDYPETDFAPQAYVDGQISVVDVYGKYPGCGGGSCWRTILVGSLGRGGQGLYALDVTEPGTYDANENFQSGAFAEANADEVVLWEFTDAGSINDAVNDLIQDTLCDALLGICGEGEQGIGALIETFIGQSIVEPLLDLLIQIDEQRGHAGLGYTLAQPNIVYTGADFGHGSDADGTGDWAVVMANGYNNTEVDLGLQDVDFSVSFDALLSVSLTGNGYMYAIDLETGSLVEAFDTKVGAFLDLGQVLLTPGVQVTLPDLTEDNSALLNSLTLPTSVPNGIGTTAVVDVDSDLSVDYVYGGDLTGSLWKLDLTSSDETNWGFHAVSGGDPAPLFQTTNFSGVPQPITTEPMVMLHPDYPVRDGQLVLLGTGELLEADQENEVFYTQSIYGLWDKNDTNTINVSDKSKFLRRFITDTIDVDIDTDLDGVQEEATIRLISDDTHDADGDSNADGPIDWSTDLGWYLDLATGSNAALVAVADNQGERIVADPVLRNDRLLISSTIVGEGVCSPSIDNWLFELDASDGSPTLLPPFDLNGDGGVTLADLYTDAQGNTYTPAGRLSEGTYNPVPTILITDTGHEVHLTSGANGEIERTVVNPIGFERSRATWRELR